MFTSGQLASERGVSALSNTIPSGVSYLNWDAYYTRVSSMSVAVWY